MSDERYKAEVIVLEALEEVVAEFDAGNDVLMERGLGFVPDTGGIALCRTAIAAIYKEQDVNTSLN